MTYDSRYFYRLKPLFWALVFWAGLLVTGLIYKLGLNAGLQFDDKANLQNLATINDLDSALAFISHGIAGPLGRPIALFSFALQHYAWPHSLALLTEWNIYIHLLNGCLLTGCALRLSAIHPSTSAQATGIAVLTGVLWLLSPLLVSSSLLIIQRMTTLSALFVFLGLWCYLSIRLRAGHNPERQSLALSVVVGIFTTLAMFTKENGALLPLYILAIEVTLLAKSRYHCNHRHWKIWQAIFLYLPLLAICFYLIIQVPYHETLVLQRDFTALSRLAAEGFIVWTYLFRAFIPMPSALGPFHDHVWQLEPEQIPLGLILFASLVIVAGAAIYTLRRSKFGIGVFVKGRCEYIPVSSAPASMLAQPLPNTPMPRWTSPKIAVQKVSDRKQYPLFAFAVLWYLLGHLLESTTIPLELYFEHRNYIPLVGPFFALVAAVMTTRHSKKILRFFIVAYIALMASITSMTTHLWGQPLLAGEIWALDNPKSVRAALYLATQLEKYHDLGSALYVLDRFNDNNPISLGLQIQALKVACAITPQGDHTERLNRLMANAPQTRYESWASEQPEHLHAWLVKYPCHGVNFNTVDLIADLMIKHKRYSTNGVILHNLYNLKAMIAWQKGHFNQAFNYFDKALSRHLSQTTLQTSLTLAYQLKQQRFIDKWLKYAQ
ncbi:MAG: hypothetical protein RQ715_07245 [Methylococcales bacterium]|nr:hypothetical protein [Methylococcales bacterium]